MERSEKSSTSCLRVAGSDGVAFSVAELCAAPAAFDGLVVLGGALGFAKADGGKCFFL